jgi:hypothetical protein
MAKIDIEGFEDDLFSENLKSLRIVRIIAEDIVLSSAWPELVMLRFIKEQGN